MASPEAIVKELVRESERLTHYLHTLPPAAWCAPSACPPWEVRDVVAHLSEMAEFYAAMVADSLRGDVSPPASLQAPGSAHVAVFGEGNTQRAIARRQRLGDHVLADFIATNDQLNRLLTSLGPRTGRNPITMSPLGLPPCGPVRRFAYGNWCSTGGLSAPSWSPPPICRTRTSLS